MKSSLFGCYQGQDFLDVSIFICILNEILMTSRLKKYLFDKTNAACRLLSEQKHADAKRINNMEIRFY